MPVIRLLPYIGDALGQPAYSYSIYIGKEFTDPTQEANKLVPTDLNTGKPVSNPFFVDKKGRYKNSNGEEVIPFISEDSYSYRIESPTGARLDSQPRIVSDAFGVSAGGGSGSTVDQTLNNFASARSADLTGSNLIYIQSYAAGWESLAAGNLGDYFAYRTGNTGAASTGNPGRFYDSTGAEFDPIPSQKLYAEMFGAVVGLGNDSYQALQDMVTAANDLGRECYADTDGLYLVSNQSKTQANYSLISNYAIDLPSTIDLRVGENTEIKNNTLNSGQYIFVGIDCANVSITGGTLNGNSNSGTTSGALYLAGCLEAQVDCKISLSAPFYFSASQARQGGILTGSLRFDSPTDYALSFNSGGCEDVALDLLDLNGAGTAIDFTNSDVDSFAAGSVKPRVSIQTISGDFIDLVDVREGAGGFFFDNCQGSGSNLFNLELGTSDVDYLKYNTIDVAAISGSPFNFVSSAGGVVLEYKSEVPKVSGIDQIFYTDGSPIVYTPLDNATRLEITLTGGGGGGAANDAGTDGDPSTLSNGSVSASGAGGGGGQAPGVGVGSTGTGGDINYTGDNGIANGLGSAGGISIWSQKGGYGVGGQAGAGSGTQGAGGGAGTAIIAFDIDFTDDITLTVGNGGVGDNGPGTDGARGAPGYILIKY